MRYTTGTLADLTEALNEALVELSAPISPADGTLASATSQLNALLVWSGVALSPADGTLASAVETYNNFVDIFAIGPVRVASYPIEVFLEHEGTVIELKDDGYSERNPVYMIQGITWEEKSNTTWIVRIEREELPVFIYEMAALETDNWNIPTPQRFRSDELTTRITLLRV